MNVAEAALAGQLYVLPAGSLVLQPAVSGTT